MSMQTFKIVTLPGDGIGVDVTAEALRVLRELEPGMPNVKLELVEHSVGAGEFLKNGDPLPASALDACREADAVLLGAMGLPDTRWPDGREMAPQLDLREELDLYAGIRPVHLYHADDTPLKGFAAGELELLIVRESTEGLFHTRLQPRDLEADQATDTLLVTRKGADRVCRAAFVEARKRRNKVSLIDKANVLPSMVYFREVFRDVAQDFPDVETDEVYVDAAALFLVKDPRRFDVMVTENMFGDILSDLTAGLVGGMGMAPSGDIGDKHAVFQPAHGSAPDIAGKGIANPVATILSLAMMLDWLGHDETKSAAGKIQTAVRKALSDPTKRAPDMGGSLKTSEMTDLIISNLN